MTGILIHYWYVYRFEIILAYLDGECHIAITSIPTKNVYIFLPKHIDYYLNDYSNIICSILII